MATIVVGCYASLAPAVWLYAGRLLLIALASMRMMALTPQLERGERSVDRDVGLNFVQPVIARWGRSRIIPD